jgi:hypothetical protein
MAILKITIAVLLTGLITILTARFWGQSQVHAPFDNGYFAVETTPSSLPTGMFMLPMNSPASCWSKTQLSELSQSAPNFILHSPVKKDKDGRFVLCQTHKNAELPTVTYTLGEALIDFPGSRFLLDIQDNVENVHIEISGIIKNAKAEARVILNSEYDVVMSATKELLPMTVFGSSASDRMRFVTFESMFIETAVPFVGDVFWTPLKVRGVPAISESIAQELRRRKKNLILGPVDSDDEWSKALKFNPRVIGSTEYTWLKNKILGTTTE